MARSATLDMTQGSLGRQIIGFSLPLMFTNLLQMLFSMVDLAVVGRFSSSAAMGSVGSTTTLIFLFTGFSPRISAHAARKTCASPFTRRFLSA